MRRWFIGFNDYWFTASVYLEKTPWYLVVANDLMMYICDFIGRLNIPIPKKWREDYDDFGTVFHIFVCEPLTQFTYNKTESKRISLPFFFLDREFPEEKCDDVWEEEYDKKRKKNKKLAAALDKKYNRVYNKILEHENLIQKGKE